MELRHLRYFVAAAETENVSKAALKLHVSQPALSRQIHDLEEELGLALFDRGAKSVRLTAVGKSFLAEARAILLRVEEAVGKARTLAAGAREELHIGYAPSPTVRLLPAALREFQARHPEVRVRLHDLSTEEMLEGVREGQLHLAFMVRPNRSLLYRLHFEELAREPMCLALAHNHALARSRVVPLATAAREPFIAFSRKEYPDYHEYLDKLSALVKRRINIREEHDSSSSLIAAVESGAGVALVPVSFSCFAGARLKLVKLSPEPEPLSIGAVWRKPHPLPLAEKFWTAAKATATTLPQ